MECILGTGLQRCAEKQESNIFKEGISESPEIQIFMLLALIQI